DRRSHDRANSCQRPPRRLDQFFRAYGVLSGFIKRGDREIGRTCRTCGSLPRRNGQLVICCTLRTSNTTVNNSVIVNPFINLKPVSGEGEIKALGLRGAVKGDSLKVTKIGRDHDPELFGLLVIYIYSGAKGAQIAETLTDSERDRLTTAGFLVRNDQVPSPVYFSCDFYNVHANLLPLRAQRRSRPSPGHDDLVVNPSLNQLGNNEITPEMRQLKIANPFDPPPLKWSDLRYVFDNKEDCNGKEAIQA